MNIVYKYGSVGTGQGCALEYLLERRTLRFASASAQNDVNEAVPNTSRLVSRELKEAVTNTFPVRATIIPSWESMNEDDFADALLADPELGTTIRAMTVRSVWKLDHRKFCKFGILSMTKSRENLLLWAHYAGGCCGAASGLCIGFDSSSAVFQTSKYDAANLSGINEVNYSVTRATFAAETAPERLADIVLTKSAEWEYEQELRCIRELADDGNAILREFEPGDVREIIVGPNMPIELILKCKRIREERFPNAALLLAQPSPEEFKMVFFHCPRSERLVRTIFQEIPNDVLPINLPKAD